MWPKTAGRRHREGDGDRALVPFNRSRRTPCPGRGNPMRRGGRRARMPDPPKSLHPLRPGQTCPSPPSRFRRRRPGATTGRRRVVDAPPDPGYLLVSSPFPPAGAPHDSPDHPPPGRRRRGRRPRLPLTGPAFSAARVRGANERTPRRRHRRRRQGRQRHRPGRQAQATSSPSATSTSSTLDSEGQEVRRRPRSSTTSASCSTRWARRSTPSPSARRTTPTPRPSVMAMQAGQARLLPEAADAHRLRGPR